MRRDRAASARPADPEVSLPRTGMFGEISSIDGSLVTVSVDDYDRGKHYFGPVPYHPATADPGVGDETYLHFDHLDRPAYAAVFT